MYTQSSLLKFVKSLQNKKKTQSGGMNVSWQLGSLLQEKSGFLASVLGTLMFQLLVVFAMFQIIPEDVETLKKIRSFFLMIILLQLAIIVVLAFVPMHPMLKFVLFTVFAVLIGITTKVALQKVPHEVIQTAILGTIAIFVTFAIVGAVLAGLGIDIGFIGLTLLICLFTLIIVSVVYLFMKQSSVINKVFAVFSLILFSLYIVYDTNIILQRDYQGDFITASLDYFLDVLNIFMNLIRFSQN